MKGKIMQLMFNREDADRSVEVFNILFGDKWDIKVLGPEPEGPSARGHISQGDNCWLVLAENESDAIEMASSEESYVFFRELVNGK